MHSFVFLVLSLTLVNSTNFTISDSDFNSSIFDESTTSLSNVPTLPDVSDSELLLNQTDNNSLTECQYTSGLESRFSDFLVTNPNYVDCDFTKKHSCYSLVSDFDKSLIQLGCETTNICANHENKCFHHDSGYICCCQTNNCNNYAELHLKLEENGYKDEFILYEWWHFPVFIISTFTLLCLFAVILAVLFVIKNISNISFQEEKDDKKLLTKIGTKKLDVVQENREIALANADIAVQEFYQFLEKRRLVKKKKARPNAKLKFGYVVMGLKLRPIKELKKIVSTRSDLKLSFNNVSHVKQNKDL